MCEITGCRVGGSSRQISRTTKRQPEQKDQKLSITHNAQRTNYNVQRSTYSPSLTLSASLFPPLPPHISANGWRTAFLPCLLAGLPNQTETKKRGPCEKKTNKTPNGAAAENGKQGERRRRFEVGENPRSRARSHIVT